MIKIPLVPQWNLISGCVCTPDGGLLYVGSRSINFISSINENDETPAIQCFHTRQNILSLDVDPHWGREQNSKENNGDVSVAADTALEKETTKLFVALQQDKSLQIWDFNKGCAIQGHKAHVVNMCHMEGNGPSPQHNGEVLISYICNRNILSVDNQDIVVYCVASNSFYRRPMFVSSRNHQLSFLKCSPYNENHFAMGTKRGLVLLCDLQKMVTLYTLRGHDCTITNLAWNRIDLTQNILAGSEKNIENSKSTPKPKSTQKTIQKQHSRGKFSGIAAVDNDDNIFDIYDFDYLDNEFGAPINDNKQKNEFISDFVGIEKPTESSTTAKFDFAEACQSLKEEINALREEQPQMSPDHIVSLEECQQAASSRDDLSSCGSLADDAAADKDKPCSDKDSSDGSIVRLACRSASSEESVDVDGMDRNKQQNIICQAEIHNSQSQDTDEIKSSEIIEKELTTDEPVEVKLLDSTDHYDILIASASSDGSCCIWNAGTGATCDTHKSKRSQSNKNLRVEIVWMSATSFIINDKNGDLHYWTLQPQPIDRNLQQAVFRTYKFQESKRRWSQRSVTALAALPAKNLLWCISTHREVILEDVKLNKIRLHYSCVSSNIGAIEECPDDMNKIALGYSDRRIGIIDISKMTPTSVYIENFVQRIESQVMSIVWSPDCKKIAYGTSEGRIGIINIELSNSNRQPFTFNSASGKPIYSINWQDKYLFVVCNLRVAVYEDDINKKDPYVIPVIENVSCISLHNNHLFVGTQSGHVQLYARIGNSYFQYELKKTFEISPRYIKQMSWSPIATNKLVVVANDHIINVVEFNHETEDFQIIRKIEISDQKATNSRVKWSNRNENNFLTCGLDGSVRVWDLSKEKNPERFVKTYHCPMTCGIFLPTDEDVIICSGKSATLEFIDMRLEKTESKSKRPNPRTMDNVLWATKALSRNEGKSHNSDKKKNRRNDENNIAILESKELANPTALIAGEKVENGITNSDEVSTMLEKLHLQKAGGSTNNSLLYMKNPSTLLYLTTKELNKDALEMMFNILTTPPKSSECNKSLCAKLYGTKLEAKELLTEELKNHQNSETKGISSIFMPQLTTNLKDEILKCVQTKQLCEWHVSLAPSISYSFWQKCCQAFAEQLVEQGYALQAASYMLAIHQQHDAIEMLMAQKYFKEALLIARIYLQPDDPLNNAISEQWITYLYSQGNLTGAALLCLLTKQNNRAYECLVKIRNTAPEIERVIRVLKSSSES